MDDESVSEIYLYRYDRETFRLYMIDKYDLKTFQRISVEWNDLVYGALRVGIQSSLFYIAALILEHVEEQQRKVVERSNRRNSRNIQMGVGTIGFYFVEAFDLDSCNRKVDNMQADRLMELLQTGLAELRAELNIPLANPVEYSYEITDKVIAAAPNEKCRQLLERLQTAHPGVIYPDLYEKIKAQIEKAFPEESVHLLRVFDETRSREHLAAISVTSEDDELCVTLVNSHGQRIRMEAWKFVNLLENPGTALRLADLISSGYREQSQVFLFNLKKKGKVVGKFTPAKATIEVVCLQESDNSVCDNGTFVIDIDYALCVYVAVKRLRDDKERFNRLKEQAENAIEHDPFEAIYQSLEVS